MVEEIITEEQEKFNKIVECAEEFIEISAKNILNKLRGTNHEKCFDIIKEKYHPLCRNLDGTAFEFNKETVLKRFCIQLQNYQKRPQTIDYLSHSYHPKTDNNNNILNLHTDDNEIFEYMKSNNKKDADSIYDYFHKLDRFEEKSHKNGCYNHNWRLYAKGLAKVSELLDDDNYINELKILCKEVDKAASQINQSCDNKIIEKVEKFFKGNQKISGMDSVLPYDFLKELYCLNLVKVDTHIKEIYKFIFHSEDTTDEILIKFIKLCLNLQKGKYDKYTPYYIDKIFWLCSTGNFYEDGITIQKMTRRNFFKFIETRLGNKN